MVGIEFKMNYNNNSFTIKNQCGYEIGKDLNFLNKYALNVKSIFVTTVKTCLVTKVKQCFAPIIFYNFTSCNENRKQLLCTFLY